MKGVFTLETPEDLLAKLVHDYDRMKTDRRNPYLAFDFFVTAEHMLDWVYPGRCNKSQRSCERNGNVLLQICSHLANGAKHFIAEDKRHKSVSGTHRGRAVSFGGANLGHSLIRTDANLGGGVSLFVRLDGDAAATYGETISTVRLAEKVIEFWRNHERFQADYNV